MNLEFKRVIIHETGHFVAHLLNQKIYELNEIEKIEITSEEIDGQLYFGGKTVPVKPPDFDVSRGVINLPQRIAVLVYGCFFQCIFLEKKFETCFDWKDSTKNGCNDHKSYISALGQFEISKNNSKALWNFIKNEYFLNLKKENILKDIFDIDFQSTLIKNGNITDINLIELKSLLNEFLLNHEEQFKGFVEKIKDFIDWEEIKTKH